MILVLLSRSTTNSTNKENRPNNLLQMNRNAFATPSEDDFDDDDDELLIAASQQVEKKLAIEKVCFMNFFLYTNNAT